jgi:hypothetical protein
MLYNPRLKCMKFEDIGNYNIHNNTDNLLKVIREEKGQGETQIWPGFFGVNLNYSPL